MNRNNNSSDKLRIVNGNRIMRSAFSGLHGAKIFKLGNQYDIDNTEQVKNYTMCNRCVRLW